MRISTGSRVCSEISCRPTPTRAANLLPPSNQVRRAGARFPPWFCAAFAPCPLVPVCRAGRHPPNQCALPGPGGATGAWGSRPSLSPPSKPKKAHHPGRKWWAMLTQRSRRRIAVRGKRTGILPNPVVRCGPLAAIDRCGFCCSQADPQAAGRRRPLGWLPESLGILQFSCGTV